MGGGLAHSLFILVRESHNYIRVRGTPESGLPQVNGQYWMEIQWGIYPAGRHYGSPDVALELRSNVEVGCQGVPGRYILHRVDSRTKVDKRNALIGCLSWHRMLCGDDAHTMSIRMVRVKCTTSAECKPIWIVESSIMDGWKDHYIAQCRFWF
jgi:hypothetical protein